MPFNGAGLFTRIYQWVNDEVLGLDVDATRTDTDSNDIASGLSNCVTRDGQSPWLGNLPAAGFKITGLGSGMNTADSVNYGQVFNSPAFVTPTATTSPAITDNSLRLATTAFAVQLAFQSSTPGQPGGLQPYNLQSVGGVAAWIIAGLKRYSRTSNAILVGGDSGTFIEITSGTFAQTFTAASTLGFGWAVVYKNSGTGKITVTPAGGDTIDGRASYVMHPGECRWFTSDGVTAFTSIILSAYHAVIDVSGNFDKPPGYAYHSGRAWSGGSSGERSGAAGTLARGGGAGGCGEFTFRDADLSVTEAVVIGAGGLPVTTTGINAGGITSLGSTKFVVNGAVGAAGGGILDAGITSGNPVGYEGGASNTTAATKGVWGGGGCTSDASSDGAISTYGAGCGGAVNAAGTLRAPGTSKFGGSGGVASAAANGASGTVPGGGGGATKTGTQSGAGADGRLEIWGEV